MKKHYPNAWVARIESGNLQYFQNVQKKIEVVICYFAMLSSSDCFFSWPCVYHRDSSGSTICPWVCSASRHSQNGTTLSCMHGCRTKSFGRKTLVGMCSTAARFAHSFDWRWLRPCHCSGWRACVLTLHRCLCRWDHYSLVCVILSLHTLRPGRWIVCSTRVPVVELIDAASTSWTTRTMSTETMETIGVAWVDAFSNCLNFSRLLWLCWADGAAECIAIGVWVES